MRVKAIGENSSNQEIASDISDANFTITTSEVVVNVRSLEFDTIQKAIDIAMPGDTVQVANGTYRGSGNVNLDFKGKAITVKSRNGPEVCVIDCEGVDGVRGFYFHNGEGSDSVVDGFTVQNGNANGDFTDGYGGGILCWGASPTIANMIIIECKSSGLGGGICCAGSPTVINTIATRNESGGDGGGISCYGGSPKIINTTITGNLSGKGIHFGNNTAAELTNTILWNNAPGEIQLNWGTPTFTCCDVRGGWSGNGTGNINKDPLFVDETTYAPRPTSPAIDAAWPNGDIGYYQRRRATGGKRIIIGMIDPLLKR